MQAIMQFVIEKWYQLRDALGEGRGQALVEYALLVSAAAVVIFAVAAAFSTEIQDRIAAIIGCIGDPAGC